MAGTYTHWMVVEDSISKLPEGPLKSLMSRGKDFVIVGAVAPDYPYLAEISAIFFKEHSWADRMHYQNTGSFIRHAIPHLPDRTAEPANYALCLAWLLGYASHILADSIIHPVVYSIVGPYLFNSTNHRHCEMTQDVMIFRRIMGGRR